MPTIKANAHQDLKSFLQEIADGVLGGDVYDTRDLGRHEVASRAFSAMPSVDMEPSKDAELHDFKLTDDEMMYPQAFPQSFGQFLWDFQAAVKSSGREVEDVIMTKASLKPYAVINVRFGDKVKKSETKQKVEDDSKPKGESKKTSKKPSKSDS